MNIQNHAYISEKGRDTEDGASQSMSNRNVFADGISANTSDNAHSTHRYKLPRQSNHLDIEEEEKIDSGN